MAGVVRAHGGDVLTGCAAAGIAQQHGQVRGARLRWQRQDHEVEAPIVVSNLGPQATVEFTGREAFEHSYLAHLDRHVHPTAILWLHFCSDERVLDYSAIAVCGTRRVNMIDSPSYDCPDTAPPGKHLYTVGGAPPNALDPGDLDAEFAEVMADLREIIPGFDERCRVLTRTCYRGKWPGFRTVPGSPVSHRTPVKGLFNVGDAACPRGYAGSMGAATSALLVRDDLRRVG
jgi:phytoene desaturase